jgi:hypothetical protein
MVSWVFTSNEKYLENPTFGFLFPSFYYINRHAGGAQHFYIFYYWTSPKNRK